MWPKSWIWSYVMWYHMIHRNCSWKRTSSQNWGFLSRIHQLDADPPLEFINIQPSKRESVSRTHQLKGCRIWISSTRWGSASISFTLPNVIKIKPDFILILFSNVFISKKVYFLKMCLNFGGSNQIWLKLKAFFSQ